MGSRRRNGESIPTVRIEPGNSLPRISPTGAAGADRPRSAPVPTAAERTPGGRLGSRMAMNDDEQIVRSAVAAPARLPEEVMDRLGDERVTVLLSAATALALRRRFRTSP